MRVSSVAAVPLVATIVHTIRTLGHGTLAAEEFVALVHNAGVEAVVDIRRFPGSRRNPHFASEEMAAWLPEHGVDYRWLSSLGGRRKPAPDSPNVGLRNEQFRAYADYMASDEFAVGVAELSVLARACRVAVMCAESVWWRCHRRLLADHLVLVEQMRVEHLFHDGRLVEHAPTPEARRVDARVVYDVGIQRPCRRAVSTPISPATPSDLEFRAVTMQRGRRRRVRGAAAKKDHEVIPGDREREEDVGGTHAAGKLARCGEGRVVRGRL
jgi:hypothetical protein